MKQKRSDQSVAIYGVLFVVAIALIGYIVLVAMDKEVPEALLALVAGSGIGGVLGWARGGTYYDPTPEVVPAPTVRPVGPPSMSAVDALASHPATAERPPTPAVYPLPDDKPVGQD